MTPERKQWWDSLPEREKMLREKIWEIKSEISWAKHRLQLGCFKLKATKLIIAGIKKQKVTLTALKHELDRTTAIVYAGYYQEAFPTCRCKKCGGIFYYAGQSHCCWCGRKIEGGVDNERTDN